MTDIRHARSPDGAGQIAYTARGTGSALVLLHPIGLNRTWWAEYVETFEVDHRVIVIDFAGHGASDPARPGTSLQDLARGVRSVLDAESAERAHVVGVSMGGMVAQHLALLHSHRVESMILCGTTGGFTSAGRPALRQRGRDALTADGMAGVIDATLDRWFSPPERTSDIRRRCADTLLAQAPVDWAACWQAISEHDALTRLRQVDMPVLVITGAADTSTPPAAAEALAEAMPNAQLQIIPDAPHLGVYEDKQPFLRAFAKFLTQQRNSPPAARNHKHRQPPSAPSTLGESAAKPLPPAGMQR